MNNKFLIVRSIYENPQVSQREIARRFCISLGKVNQVIKEAEADGFILRNDKPTGAIEVTKKGLTFITSHKVDAAIILACGLGLRLAPLTYDTPKSFIKIKGERMIERQIEQLQKVGIKDITIMVGYLKEKFDYLVDKYGVRLVYNEEYKIKNTLSTFFHAIPYLKGKNVYVCVSDVYIEENIYHEYECEPYYIGEFYEDCKDEWRYITNSKNEIKKVETGGKNDYCLVGPCFLTKEFLDEFIPMIEKYYAMTSTDNFYWEDVLVRNFDNLPTIYLYKLDKGVIHEFDTISDIKEYDSESNGLGSEAIDFVTRALKVDERKIKDISCVKEGMTNHSYRFSIDDVYYIARVPGEGTEKFIDRKNEYEVYKALKPHDITEEVVFFDENTGYKISKYFDDSRTMDITKENELKDAMKIYKKLHSLDVKVKGSCDIIDKINEYLFIINDKEVNVAYEDFDEVLSNAKKLEAYVKKFDRPVTLCHGDANPGNVLYTNDGVKLIDFEYAGMADPLSEIALFGIYVDFDIEKTLSLYKMYCSFENDDKSSSIGFENLVVAYMALGGLYSALWAIVREAVGGADYGSYGMRNYRIFKNCYKYLQEGGRLK